MNKQDYTQKLKAMLDEGIIRAIYQQLTDAKKLHLETFQGFLFRNLKNNPSQEKMRPKSNQPVKLCATANTLKLKDIDERTVEKLKFRTIVNQTDTATYDATKVIDDYLKPLACNDCLNDVINDCFKLPDMLKMLPPLQKDEEYVSYDFDSLFKNISLKEKIGYIIHKICKTDCCSSWE